MLQALLLAGVAGVAGVVFASLIWLPVTRRWSARSEGTASALLTASRHAARRSASPS